MPLTTHEVTTRHGTMRVVDGDRWVSRSLELLGEYSKTELDFLITLIQSMSRHRPISFVEAGAYIGDLTVPLSRYVSVLHAFEPQAEIREILEHNLRVNGCDNVIVYPFALGDHEETLHYTTDIDSPGSTQMSQSTGDREVKMIPLDSLELNVDLLKADVEGMEIPLLAGAQSTLSRCRPVLFLERDTVPTPGNLSHSEVCDILAYSCLPLQFPLYTPDNFRIAENPFGSTCSFMTLAAPRFEMTWHGATTTE